MRLCGLKQDRRFFWSFIVLFMSFGFLVIRDFACCRNLLDLALEDIVIDAESFLCTGTGYEEIKGMNAFDKELCFIAPVLVSTELRYDSARQKTENVSILQEQKNSDHVEEATKETTDAEAEGEREEYHDYEALMIDENGVFTTRMDPDEHGMTEDEGRENGSGELDFWESNASNDEDHAVSFVEHERLSEISIAGLRNYEDLVKQFYTIDPTTMIGSDQLDVDKLLEMDMRLQGEVEGPQILIYHTHSQEAFSDSIPGDPQTSVVGIGEELARILREKYGYQVLHHEGEYDKPSRNEAYSKALPEIEKILADNPSIEVVIDLHRDEMPLGTRLVTEVDGKQTAKFMFFNGLSRTKRTGNLDYLYNPYQEENLAFSFQMEKAAQEYYPGLTRKIYLKGYRYNMHLKPKTLLIELGAQNNTVEEAMNACGPLAHLLHLVLSGDEMGSR